MEDVQRRERESTHTAERLSDEMAHAHALEAEMKEQKVVSHPQGDEGVPDCAETSFARCVLCGAWRQERAEAAQHRSEHALHAAQAAAYELRASLQSVEDQAAEVRLRLEQARAETAVEHTARTEAEAHARAADEQHQRDVEEMQAFQRALSGTLERVEIIVGAGCGGESDVTPSDSSSSASASSEPCAASAELGLCTYMCMPRIALS
jgi:hypothetical protein